jgi:hypothetical protein
MKRLIPLFLVLSLVPTTVAKPKKQKSTCGATSIAAANCPKEGCGGDAELNRRKNLVTAVTTPTEFRRQDFVTLTFPAKWQSGQNRTLLKDWGEGRPLVYEAFLLRVKPYKDGMEACNCNLKGDDNNDFHLVTGHKKTTAEDDSVTAEITPRFRPDGWTLTKLQQLAKQKAFVRIAGYLMLDTQHLNSDSPARVTDWEIQPVMSMQVCTGTVTSCKAGNNWQNLSNFPEP